MKRLNAKEKPDRFIPTEDEYHIVLSLARKRVRSSGLDPECVYDLAQEVMVKLVERWNTYDPSKDRTTWINAVALHTFSNLMPELYVVRLPKSTYQRGAEKLRVHSRSESGEETGVHPTVSALFHDPPGFVVDISRAKSDLLQQDTGHSEMELPTILECLWKVYRETKK